ncbi:MAG: CapA family protein [Anaerolineae bacterium]|nr:CapA family protein [Anaerolineae bacterium]
MCIVRHVAILIRSLLVGCAVVLMVVTTSGTTRAQPPATPTLFPTPLPLPPTTSVWVAPSIPRDVLRLFEPLRTSLPLAGEQSAEVQLVSAPSSGLYGTTWVYVPVVPFPTVADNIQLSDVLRYWQGDASALGYLNPRGKAPILYLADTTLVWLQALLGAPAAAAPIMVVPEDGLASALWVNRPAAWSILPFDRLDPALKVLTVDGRSVFDRSLRLDQYPFVQYITLTGNADKVNTVVQVLQADGHWPPTNRDVNKMTIAVMTGVTALVRATAFAMETNSINFPAQDLLPFLADADIVHTSNEVSFSPNCPYPNPAYQADGLVFCSRDTYFDLLKTIHLNVVELTGNHVLDWGTAAMTHTLDIYDANKIAYFGGGRNTEDARKSMEIDDHGNSIAFIGCNPAGPLYAWATAEAPGSAACDDDFMRAEIARLKMQGKIVIVTLQYEEYYTYTPPPDQVEFFKKYTDFGADLVMGSQAHQPQGFGFTEKAFIHYGIGNLFFDQMADLGTRQMFADKLIFYNGRHLSTVLFTGLIEDYARPRPMTAQERTDFLTTIFQASGW